MNGAFAEYVAVPAANAYVLPDTISYREAALIEPLSCAVHGMHRLNAQVGDSILIVGAGTMVFSFEAATNLISREVVDAKALLTQALPLEAFSDALSMVQRGEGVKTQILPSQGP